MNNHDVKIKHVQGNGRGHYFASQRVANVERDAWTSAYYPDHKVCEFTAAGKTELQALHRLFKYKSTFRPPSE